MKKSLSWSRRELLRGSVLGAAATLVAGMAPAPKLRAADLPQVAEDDAVAKSLKYVHDAAKSERPDANQLCHNCQYFKGKQSTTWAPCDIFPGKAVNANGWCSVWSKKA